jgi:hypothetical protein
LITLIGYVLFQSAQAATQAETLLRREGFAVRLVPVPRHVSAECGTGLSFDPQGGLAEHVEARLRELGVPFVAIRLLETEAPGERKGGGDGP